MFGLFTGSSSDSCFQYRRSFRAAEAKNQRGSSRILRTISVLSHKYTHFKNNARPSCRCFSLCKHFKLSVSLYIPTVLDVLQGGPLMQGEGYIRTGHFLWKALKFFLSPEAKMLDFDLEFIAKVSLF